jgi:hypothetical protein
MKSEGYEDCMRSRVENWNVGLRHDLFLQMRRNTSSDYEVYYKGQRLTILRRSFITGSRCRPDANMWGANQPRWSYRVPNDPIRWLDPGTYNYGHIAVKVSFPSCLDAEFYHAQEIIDSIGSKRTLSTVLKDKATPFH